MVTDSSAEVFDPAASTSLRRWAGFAMMCIGMFMAILDIQVVATSLPTIQHALGMAPDQMSWIQTAYLTAEVIAIPLTGVLTRLLTMRGLFVASVTIFTVASGGCAASDSFASLIVWRVLQGFSGGTLIPAVFSAVILLFPVRGQGPATTVAGLLAVLAPTVGPIVGGWITTTYSWHWLFLINVAPGVLCAIGAALLLPAERPEPGAARGLHPVALILLAVCLAALEIALKDAPHRGWTSPEVAALLATSAAAAALFAWRSLRTTHPIVDLHTLAEPTFAVSCLLSFVFGMGLFGSVYLMPVFLAGVRGHDALEIGRIMLVTGVAQLVAAPVAVALERRIDARWMVAFGFVLFGIGLGMSAFQTSATDFRAMLWPQLLRGLAIMFCLLPPTRLALGALSLEKVPGASGLFNLTRNLGGAIGLALIDTVIYGRAPVHAGAIAARLQAGDTATAIAVGIPLDMFAGHTGSISPEIREMISPMVERLALVQAINDAWAMIAILTFAALLAAPWLRRPRDFTN
jgi:DHA2 family multidrug resistance protein